MASSASLPALPRWVQAGLGGLLVLGLALLLALLATGSTVLTLAPLALLLGGVASVMLFAHPLANLFALITGFSLVANAGEEGFQIVEIAYGLYLALFFVHWFATRATDAEYRIFANGVDYAIGGLLLLFGASVPLGMLHGADLSLAISEMVALSLLGVYFPCKEACARYEKGPAVVIAAFLALAAYIIIRNAFGFREILISATMAWEIARGRVVTNETVLVRAALIALIALIYSDRLRRAGLWLLFLITAVASLILTQGRAYWIDYIVACGLLMVLVPTRQRVWLVALGILGAVGTVGALLIFFGDTFVLLAIGVAERFVSIGSAGTQDLSLINRFYETRAVIELIAKNPVVGYGLGVEYAVYDVIAHATISKAFAHNGYLMIWYKVGLLGLIPFLYAWGAGIAKGLRVYRHARTERMQRYGLIGGVLLASTLLSSLVSAPFTTFDTSLALGVWLGFTAGVHARASLGHSVSATSARAGASTQNPVRR